MADQELRSLMERLRATMDESEVSEQQRVLLEKVEFHLHNEGEPDPEEPSMREAVEVLIEALSAEHPRSASLARSVLEALASMGI